MAGVLPTAAGVSLGQVAYFVSSTLEVTRRLCEECLQLDYLFAEGPRSSAATQTTDKKSLH